MHTLEKITLISLSTVSIALIAMDPPMPLIKRSEPLTVKPIGFTDDDDNEYSISPHPQKPFLDRNDSFENIDTDDLELVFSKPNSSVQFLTQRIHHLKRFGPNHLFLFGGPGFGKTVLAKTLAYKICLDSDWSYEYISAHEFIGPWRNQPVSRFQSYLKKITELDKPTILILDNLYTILEDPMNPNRDSGITTCALTEFMDKNRRRTNLFTIGILHSGYNICKRLISRIGPFCTYLEKPEDTALKRVIFTSKFINQHMQLDPEATKKWLEKFLDDAHKIQGGHFRYLAEHIKKKKENSGNQYLITKNDLEKSLESYKKEKGKILEMPVEPFSHERELEHLGRMAAINLQHQERMTAMKLQHQQNMRTNMLINTAILSTPIALLLYTQYREGECTIL